MNEFGRLLERKIPRLRRYASETLPMLYRDLQQAQAIAARLGA